MNKRFRLDFLVLTVLCLIAGAVLYSCRTEPSDLGINFIDPNDTTGTFVLDSQTDTMSIGSNNYKKFLNTYGSSFMMIGAVDNFEAKSFLKYNGITSDYDSATVLSSVLSIQYADYSFKDSNASVSFNVYRITRDLNFNTITYDSVLASDIGATILGTYTGIPNDSTTVSLSLDNQLIKDWLEYAADSVNYPVKNYGIALVPNLSSASIKAFKSSFSATPNIVSIVTKNGETDTLSFSGSISVWIANAPSSILMPDRFVIQNGIAFNDLMTFNLSKLPSNVIINEALLTLTLDTLSSFLRNTSDRRLTLGLTNDSTNKNDTLLINSLTPENGVYKIRLNQYFQLWNNGTFPNLGIIITSIGQYGNFDKYVFYSPTYSDLTKVPRLRIRYTPRIQ